jgi:outer membrane protein assembly factor BamD
MQRVQTCHTFAAALMAGMLLLSGCSWFKTEEGPEPVEVLDEKGTTAFNDSDYRDALKNFEKLRDWYPFSKYVALAELKIGDCHYHLQEYEDAILAYEQFVELHPSNEAVPYAIYQKGRCYFDRIGTIDRDQSATRQALETFRQLQKQYPNDIYSERAVEHINTCLKDLAENEFYIGMFYFKSSRYKAALERFKAVVKDYPDVGVHRQALSYIARCEAQLAREKADDSP